MIEFIFPLDFFSPREVEYWDQLIGKEVDVYKIGYQLFISQGPELVKNFTEKNKAVFLDLKLHDIPNTVEQGTKAAVDLGVKYLTVHASGGAEMIQSAKKSAGDSHTKILAVTVLTSISQQQSEKIFKPSSSIRQLVLDFADYSYQAGADGVICSVWEASLIRETLPPEFLIITPGIRMAEKQRTADDQQRVATPAQAKSAGVNGIVMGRPVINSADPVNFISKVKQQLRE
ncbi:MAG: orotidine-5'-phosphate decarboxylase [bacterium]